MSTISTAASSSMPKRHRWWIGALTTAIFVGVACLGLWIYRAVAIANDWRSAETETDAREPRWRLAELEADRPPIADADNAGLQIIFAHAKSPKLCVSNVKGYHEIFAKLKPVIQLNSQQIDLIRKQLDLAPAAITEARKLKNMPHGRFTVRFSLDYGFTQCEDYQRARDISGWLLHDAYHLAQEKRCDEALDNCQAILNIGRTIGDDRFLSSQLTRIRHQQMATETAERVLAQGQASQEGLLALQLLITCEMAESNWIGSLKGTRAGWHYCFDNLRTGKLTWNPLPRFWFTAREQMSLLDRMEDQFPQGMLQHYPAHLRFMNRLIEIAKLPLHGQKTKLNELANRKAEDPLGALPLSVCVKLHEAELRSQGLLRTTLVALACERYRLKHQRWPATLDVLIAEKLLPALPIDPVDGRLLRYRHDADGIIVYSIGINEKDDQGNIVRAPLGDQRFVASRHDAIGHDEDVGFRLWNESRRRDVALPPVVLPSQ